jgi:DNA-directed RNA polymerase subunit RPC12/RpoP
MIDYSETYALLREAMEAAMKDKYTVTIGGRGNGKRHALELRLNKTLAEIERLRDCIGQLEEILQECHEAMQESVRHGKWVKTSEFMPIYCCSECKERNLFDSNGNNVLSDHCPNCGVRMERE